MSVWVPIDDGFALAATSWEPANPIGTALFVHGCLKDQREFARLPAALYEAGWNVVTYDLYSHGDSRTPRIEIVSQETHDAVLGRVSDDAARVLAFFEGRSGKTGDLALFASGCTGAWISDLVRESKALSRIVLFSGPLDPEAQEHLQDRADIAVLGISSEDDVERMRVALGRSVEASTSPGNALFLVPSGGHGAGGLLSNHGEAIVSRVLAWLSEPRSAR